MNDSSSQRVLSRRGARELTYQEQEIITAGFAPTGFNTLSGSGIGPRPLDDQSGDA